MMLAAVARDREKYHAAASVLIESERHIHLAPRCLAAAIDYPNRKRERSFAFSASTARSRVGAWVCSDVRRRCAASETSVTARSNAASLACDGLLKPDSLRTNCSAEAWISSSVAGGSKLNSVLMLRHMMFTSLCLPPGRRAAALPRTIRWCKFLHRRRPFYHRIGHAFTTTTSEFPRCLTSPTKSFSTTAAGPTPSTACFRRVLRRTPGRWQPPSAPPANSGRPGG